MQEKKEQPGFSLQSLPVWVPYAVIGLLTLIFFMPFLASSDMIFGTDTVNGIYSRFFYADFFSHYHDFPRWLSVTLSGMPTLEAFMADMFYPLTPLQFIMDVPRALGYKFFFTIMVAGLFMYLFLKQGLRLRSLVALFGAIAYMFNTEFVSHLYPGHDGKMFVISLLPLALFGLKRLVDTRALIYSAMLACAIGLMLLSSHVQTTYFALWGIGFFFLFETMRYYLRERSKAQAVQRSVLFTFAIVLGLGLGMIQFLPPYKFSKTFSVRGEEGEKTSYEHAISWSLHPEETAALVVPEFCGFADKDNLNKVVYWGRNYFKLNNEYAGIVVLVCAFAFLIFFRRDPMLIYWGCIALGALVYALGGNTPFFYLFYTLVPGVKLFRGPSMIMFWFSMALAIMASYGLNRLFDESNTLKTEQRVRFAKNLLITFVVCAGLTLVVSGGRDMVLGIWKGVFYSGFPAEKNAYFNANYPAFIKGAWFALLFGGGALLGLYAFLKERLTAGALAVLLSICAAADLMRVDSYFYKLVNPAEYLAKNEPALNDLALKSRTDRFRVLPVPGHTGQNDVQRYGLESALGFHDNELKTYREFTGGQERDNLLYLLKRGVLEGNPFLDLLNVKYIVYRPGQNKPLVYALNRGACARAFCAPTYEVVPEKEISARLRAPGFPYKEKLLLEKAVPLFAPPALDSVSQPAPGIVTSMVYEGDVKTYNVTMQRPGLLFLSEVYLPYWKAYDKGEPAEIYKTDGALMSIPLAAGDHSIVVRYESPNIKLGARITFLALIFCAGIVIFYLLRRQENQ